MKVRIIRNVLQHGNIYAKKGDIVDVPNQLAKQWIDAKYVEAVAEKPKKAE
jgi:hypothetical protein